MLVGPALCQLTFGAPMTLSAFPMSLPKARVIGAFAVAIVAATAWFLATKKHSTDAPSPASAVRTEETTPSPEKSSPTPPDSTASKPSRQRSVEERAAALKHILAVGMAPMRDEVTERLVQQGLSREDAEQAGERYRDGYVNCLFDAARRQYEAEGISVNEFLDRAEQRWSLLLRAFDIDRARWATLLPPCVANIRQQTGMPLSAAYASPGSADELATQPAPPPPPWAAEMENRIQDHVASHPGLGATDALVDCEEAGCSVILVGSDIRVFDFDFDVFAEQTGFARAVVRGSNKYRQLWLER